ncbi:TonB-dependent siderophore receptor [Phenylobacterium sp. LjRoot225]|uniref:TonB-dependent receptor n=1 Tax=Phenylobacterium sp. LjRoot225 TaxID=3342285 RepID=UPI003ECDCAB6
MRRFQLLLLATAAFAPVVAMAEEATNAVSELQVMGQRRGYTVETVTTATKIAAPLEDIPQTVDVVSGAMIQAQRALSLQDVLRNVPGVGLASGDGQRDQVSIRGFTAIADQFVDGFRDDALYFRDLSNVEQVEVLKGPASVLYGRGSSGGLVNRVTKKPGGNLTGLALSYGGFDDKRLEFDLARTGLLPSVSGRLTGAIEGADGYRDQQFLDRKALGSSVAYAPTAETRLLLQGDYVYDRRVMDLGIPAYRGRPVEVEPSTYYGAANARKVDFVRSEVWSSAAVLEHRFSDSLSLRNGLRYYEYQLDRNSTLPGSVNEAAQTVSLNRSNVQRDEHGWSNQLELTHDVVFIARHQLLYGLELSSQTKEAVTYSRTGIATVDLFNPVGPVLPLAIAGAPSASTLGRFDGTAAYVQDLLSFGEHWKALVGVRYDRFRQKTDQRLAGQMDLARTDTAWSPRAGLVWQPAEGHSYYASWSRSFQPSGEAFAVATNNVDIEPEETTNKEVGAKWSLLGGKLHATASLFELTRTGIKSTDPVTLTLIPIGEQRTRGLELSGALDLGDGWRGVASYAYMDAKVVRSLARDAGQPVQGKRATLTPKTSANLWLSKGFGDRFGLGGGVSYVGDRFANPGNTVVLPSYVTLDLMAWKRVGAVTWQLNVYNVTDEGYIVSAHGTSPNLNVPGAPRSAMLTVRLAY